MAAKIVSGVNGSITFPTAVGGQTVQITDWTATIQRDIHDVSNFDDTDNWRKKQGGMAHLTGSCTGFFDADVGDTDKITTFGTEDAAPTASCVLQAYTAKTFSFTGILGNLTVTVSKTGGPVAISFTFESSGAVSEA